MLRGKWSDSKWYSRLGLWLGLMLALTIPMMILWFILTHGSDSVAAAKRLQLWQTLTIFILPSLLGVYLWSEQPLAWLHLDRGMTGRTALVAVGTMLIAVPAINLLSHLNQQLVLPSALHGLEEWMRQMEDAAAVLTERFLRVDSVGGLLINLGLMAVLPAVGEELTFRGVLQGQFSPKYRTAAIWITAAIFSFIHMQFYGFVPRMLMGVLFGYMLVWTGSLWVPMLMHMTNNAVAVLSFYLSDHLGLGTEWMEEFGAGSTWYVGVLSLLAVTAICYFFARGRSSAPRP